jgi:DNA-binding NarL/FixJ family response regulator
MATSDGQAAVRLNAARRRGQRISVAALANYLSRCTEQLDGDAVAILREAAAAAVGPDAATRRVKWLTAAVGRTPVGSSERTATLRTLVDALQDAQQWGELAGVLCLLEGPEADVFFLDHLRALQNLSQYDDVLSLLERAPTSTPDHVISLYRTRALLMKGEFRVSADLLRSVLALPVEPGPRRVATVGLLAVSALSAPVADLLAIDLSPLGVDVASRHVLDELRDAAAHADFVGLERALVGRDLEPEVGARSNLLTRARHAYLAGRWGDEVFAPSTIVAQQVVDPGSDHSALVGLLALVAVHRGELGIARRRLAHCEPLILGGSVVATARAAVARSHESPQRARAILVQAIGELSAMGQIAGIAGMLREAVELDVEVGDERSADEHLHLLEEIRTSSGSTVDLAHQTCARAIRHRDVATARIACRAYGPQRPFDLARALLLVVALDGGDSTAASHAQQLFTELGAKPWRRRLVHRLRLNGSPVPRRGGTSQPVTERRRKIIDLVGDGHSNHHIARMLGVSTKTVESDLTAIYARTGHHSRVALARHAHEANL